MKKKTAVALLLFTVTFAAALFLLCGLHILAAKGCGADALTASASPSGIYNSGSVAGGAEKSYSLTLTCGKKKWAFTPKDFELTARTHLSVYDLHKRGTINTYAKRLEFLNNISGAGLPEEAAMEYLFPGLGDKLKSVAAQLREPATDAVITMREAGGAPKFDIAKEKEGREADIPELISSLAASFRKSPFAAATVQMRTLPAAVTADQLRAVANLRCRFTTGYAQSSADRKSNVSLALSRFNCLRVMPGEEVSFNKRVGARTAANGFKEAKIIVAGRFEDGVGGGVCQSSTTLYNALLLGGLTVVKSYQHSLPVGYVEPGFDAMVNSGYADLVFRNDGSLPVFIRTVCTANNASAEVYGAKLPHKIVRVSEVTEKIPAPGDEFLVDKEGKYADKAPYKGERVRISYPKEGLKSVSYLEYYEGGRLKERKQIRKNTYAAQKGLIVEGIQERPVIPDPPEPEEPGF